MLEPTCPKCKKHVIERAKCPTCGYMITPNDFLKYIEPPTRRPLINGAIAGGISCALFGITLFGLLASGIGDGFTFGAIFLFLLIALVAFVCFWIGIESLRKARSLYDNYHDNPEEYKLQLANVEYKKHIEKAAQPTFRELEAMRLQQEYDEAVASQQAGEPWRIRYATYPCPHCGHYKVRCANWDDKKLSVAFWGPMSGAIAKSYKCEFCNQMW